MAKHPHPPIEALLALTGDAPAPGEPAADPKWEEHLRSCAACSELYRELVAWREAVERGDAGDAPEISIRRAQDRAIPQRFFAPLRGSLRAAVMFDSGTTLAGGTRSDALQGRQWVLASDRLEIEVSMAPERARETPPLSGQLLQAEGAKVDLGRCRVVLMEAKRESEETLTRESGDFLFRTRPAGPFQLRLEGEGWSIVTPLLEP